MKKFALVCSFVAALLYIELFRASYASNGWFSYLALPIFLGYGVFLWQICKHGIGCELSQNHTTDSLLISVLTMFTELSKCLHDLSKINEYALIMTSVSSVMIWFLYEESYEEKKR